MQEVLTFNFENLPVTTLTINNEPHFVGKEIAQILGYKKPANAINKHVDEDDKGVTKLGTPGGAQNVTIINESGLYSLIFSSKLESAKRFKRWVTSEVLPTLRKTGTYQVPNDPMQALKLMFQATEQTKEEIATVKADVIDLKDNQKLDAGEYSYVTKSINQRVAEVKRIYSLNNTKEINKELYKDINSEVKKMAGINTRTQLKQKHFNDIIQMVVNWFPSQSTMYHIRQLEMKFEDGI